MKTSIQFSLVGGVIDLIQPVGYSLVFVCDSSPMSHFLNLKKLK